MIRRIVKMEFHPENIDGFLGTFNQKKDLIESFEGCSYLQLLRDKNNPHIFFTHSHWKDEDALNNYRNSDLFKGVWIKTKALFSARPEAWSTEEVVSC